MLILVLFSLKYTCKFFHEGIEDSGGKDSMVDRGELTGLNVTLKLTELTEVMPCRYTNV